MALDINQLASELLQHRIAYENGNPTITDAVYDAKEMVLRKLAPSHPIFSMVGAPSLGLDVRHQYPMISQEKALTIAEAVKWMAKHIEQEEEYVATLKMDGMSCALHYKKGVLLQAVSRGDGDYGKDITAKVSMVVPTQLVVDFTGEIRGELVLSMANYSRLNQYLLSEGLEEMKNIRNAVPGVINEDAISFPKINLLSFRVFGIVWECSKELKYSVFEGKSIDTYSSDLMFAQSLGFQTVFSVIFTAYSGENLTTVLTDTFEDFITYRNDSSNGDNLPLDGVVIRVNSNDYYNELGFTAHHPRGSVAWKFAADSAEVIIKDIIWSVGTKDISPVGIFEPTLIGGALIQKVSLKSVKNMVEKGVTLGSRAVVVRSGDVIPWLKEVV